MKDRCSELPMQISFIHAKTSGVIELPIMVRDIFAGGDIINLPVAENMYSGSRACGLPYRGTYSRATSMAMIAS